MCFISSLRVQFQKWSKSALTLAIQQNKIQNSLRVKVLIIYLVIYYKHYNTNRTQDGAKSSLTTSLRWILGHTHFHSHIQEQKGTHDFFFYGTFLIRDENKRVKRERDKEFRPITTTLIDQAPPTSLPESNQKAVPFTGSRTGTSRCQSWPSWEGKDQTGINITCE